MANKISVLVVDDSALMRKKITEIIDKSSDCKVIALAKDGFEALNYLEQYKPQVITLDLHLPNMDGLTCLNYIMKERPTPVIVLSSLTQEGSNLAMKALDAGAFDIIAKPGGVVAPEISTVSQDLLNKIRMAVTVAPYKLQQSSTQTTFSDECHPFKKVVVIGASTGGPSAVYRLLESIPKDLPASYLLVQHMPGYFIQSFAKRLNSRLALQVRQAQADDILCPGTLYVAPFGYDMELSKESNEVKIQLKENNKLIASPSVDATFISVASILKEKALGVILTGMGKDGTKGCLEIKKHKGKIIAQDEDSSIVFGMPKSAIEAHAVDKILPLNQIANAIIEEVSYSNGQ